jgi:hypothetical protein
MKWFPSFGFQRRKRELQEEIDAHLQMAIADRVARGETAETARQAAAREFGNIPLVQDVTRDMWGQAWLEQLAGMSVTRYGNCARAPALRSPRRRCWQ